MINIAELFLDFYFTPFLFGGLAFYGIVLLFRKIVFMR